MVPGRAAGEGRPITPAGTLVIDATTHLPAVGACHGDASSPDSLGHGGKGRYLLVVNSGFGVQFSETRIEPQQSIAVIDLNVTPEPLVFRYLLSNAAKRHVAWLFSPLRSPMMEFMNCTFPEDSKISLDFPVLSEGTGTVHPESAGPTTKVQALL